MRFMVGIKGNEEDIDEFTILLRKHDMSYQRIDIKHDGELRTETWSHNRSLRIATDKKPKIRSIITSGSYDASSMINLLATLGVAVLSAVIVELTKDSIKHILSWLRDEKKKDCELEIVLKGNVLKLSRENFGLLEKVLEKKSGTLERRKKRRRKRKS